MLIDNNRGFSIRERLIEAFMFCEQPGLWRNLIMTMNIPQPLADDPTYFQILLDSKVDASRVHLTLTANKMLRTSATIEAITWLTGGGANHDDYSEPVMQMVDSTSGASKGADFNKTYDILLSDLPKDSNNQYFVLKIPFLNPDNSDESLVGSGHLTITLDAPATMQINKSGKGFAFALPSPATNGAGSNKRWDFVELNCATPASNGKPVCFCNTSNVDFFSLGLAIKGRQSDGSYATFGLDLSSTNPVDSLIEELKSLPAEYTAGLVDSNSTFLRFQAPDLSFSSTSTCLDTAITDGFNHYKTNTLSFSVAGKLYEATSDGETLTFSKPCAFTVSKPSTLDVIASTGPLKTDQTQEINDALKYIDAALNRGVFTNTDDWEDESKWYPEGIEYNAYAKLLHEKFLGKACYAFSFDDVPGAPTVSVPAIGTCTSMTLVITEG